MGRQYADASKTAFKSATRLECMMQDMPYGLLPGARVGFTTVNQVRVMRMCKLLCKPETGEVPSYFISVRGCGAACCLRRSSASALAHLASSHVHRCCALQLGASALYLQLPAPFLIAIHVTVHATMRACFAVIWESWDSAENQDPRVRQYHKGSRSPYPNPTLILP